MDNVIKVYGTDTCPKCNIAKQYLKKRGVQFEAINILDAPEVADKLASQGVMSLPVVMLGDKFTTGFNQKEIDELIKEVE